VYKWNGVCTVHVHLTWAGPDDVCLVLLVPFLSLLVVLEVWEDTRKHSVELGETRWEWAGNLLALAIRTVPVSSSFTDLSQAVEKSSIE